MDRYSIPIKNWPEDEKPREKLLKYGEHKLTDTELLAILIRTGSKGETAVDIARRIMQKFGSFRNMSHTSIHKWKDIKGLGKAKLCQIKSAIEIGRRFREEELKGKKVKITGPEDVFSLLLPRMRDLKKEIFVVIHLDAKNNVFDRTEIEEGTVNQANPIVREIFYKAMENFSVSIICVHNHPSGDPSPSKEDIEFTKALVKAGEVLNIKVVDHIIIGDDRYYSFAKSGLI
ncbi:MAG: DNA repair protein RadC [Candidatus Omnitrophica bacterium]|nr:DNA repair protein RadC [Candidatus Omnitrophota bacterium]